MFHIGIDIGGTFTDCVLIGADVAGRVTTYRTAKALSTKGDPADGVMAGLTELAASVGLTRAELLSRTTRFGHGTTIGTNAVLERTGARVGVITTAGHGDALAIMRGHGRVAGRGVEDVFRVRGTSLPAPLIVPGAVLELHERVDSGGKIVVALDESRATAAVTAFIAEHRLDSVAVAFLWSFANPEHELAVEKIIRMVAPDVFVSLSCRVSPRLGEFERTVAAVLNGYVGPACTRYLSSMGDRLAADDLQAPLLVMHSSGGVVPAAAAAEVALGTLDSGPTAGLTGVAALAAARGDRNVVATDMGGTSFDIGLVVDGQPIVANEAVIDQYTYRIPHLDIRATACGGGTIARRDPRTGALRVGPDSAGAEPGPACYGRGGAQATVTDADVVLGLLRPDGFLGGRMPLDETASRAVVGRLAQALGLSLEETAAGIVSINNLRAATLIRQQTLERGLDPRDFVLYSYGGAGPVHAFGYAAEIGVREVLIPLGNGASTLSAYGIAAGDVNRFVEVEVALRAPFGDAALFREIAGAVSRARQSMAAAGIDAEPRIDAWALMRYQEQLMHSLEVLIDPADCDTSRGAVDGLADRLAERFTREYARRYGESAASAFQAAEIFALRVRARVPAAVSEVTSGAAAAQRGPASGTVRVFWPGTGERLETTSHDGSQLADGAEVAGPALIELSHTTIAVPPGASLTADGGHFRLRLPGPQTPAAPQTAAKGAA
jgi:N-methylhydantoinase A